MSTPFKALDEMIRLTSPFPESVTVKDWKASGGKVIGWVNQYVPLEIIHAAGCSRSRLPATTSRCRCRASMPHPVQHLLLHSHLLAASARWQVRFPGRPGLLRDV